MGEESELRTFEVRVLVGNSSNGGGSGFGFAVVPPTIWARSRVEAYVRLYQTLYAKRPCVTVSGVGGPGAGRPLGFTPEEIARVREAGVPLEEALVPAEDCFHVDSIEEPLQ